MANDDIRATPRLKAPAGACDTHMHFYDARYPTAPTATMTPPDASVADYRAVQRRLGLSRTVIVKPTTYGTDNRAPSTASPGSGSTARAASRPSTTASASASSNS